MKTLILVLTSILVLSACSGSGDKQKSTNQEAVKEKPVAVKSTFEDLSVHPGFALYKMHCLPCHQADGNGIPGMYPGLHNTKWVNGDIATLVNIVVNGMDEEIEVNGEYYNRIMVPLSHLTNQEVADVLTFVRKKFGTNASEVTVSEVTAIRNAS
jgi:mono/diheme cytochrome c family protein